MNFLNSLLRNKKSPLENIAELQERKKAGGIIKYLDHEEKKVRKAAMDALTQMISDLSVKDLASLMAVLTNPPKERKKELKNLSSIVQAKAFDKIIRGMSEEDVIKLMGQPDQLLNGQAYIKYYRVSVIMARGDAGWLTDPHWIYKMKDAPRDYYLVVFENGKVSDASPHFPDMA